MTSAGAPSFFLLALPVSILHGSLDWASFRISLCLKDLIFKAFF
jgi:hypothetical protein